MRLSVLVPLVLLPGFEIFDLAGCTLGLTHPGGCQHIPDWLGDIAFLAGLAGYVLGLYLAPVLIVVAVVIEVLARRR